MVHDYSLFGKIDETTMTEEDVGGGAERYLRSVKRSRKIESLFDILIHYFPLLFAILLHSILYHLSIILDFILFFASLLSSILDLLLIIIIVF